MAEHEVVIEITDLKSFHVFCGNPDCPTPYVGYDAARLGERFEKRCPRCGTVYPESLVSAVEHYLHFFKEASHASESSLAQISVKVRLD